MSLAESIKYMIFNPEIAEQMATSAKEIATNHSDQSVFDAWENFCKTIAEK